MHYIFELMPVFPLMLLVSIAVYGIIYISRRRMCEKQHVSRMLAEFMLVGWFVVLTYVTQIKSFGNGMGDLYNIKPLRPFVVAFRYGSNNAGMVWQFLLNIIMFVPLGLLLPFVFPNKYRTWPNIACISFCTTLIVELLQLISRRGTDIDDIIANTMGGLCGFALYLLLLGLFHLIKRRQAAFPNFRRKLIGGIMVLCMVAGVFITLKYADGLSEFGNLYYGHLRPTKVEVGAEVSDKERSRGLYRYTERVTLEELQEFLIKSSGFDGQFIKKGSTYVLTGGEDQGVYIYPYHTWSVYYADGRGDTAVLDRAPDEETSLVLAWGYLKSFAITSDTVAYQADISDLYADHCRHLAFVSTQNTESVRVEGTVIVSIGEDGRLLGISDDRKRCESVKMVDCISPKASIEVAQDIGLDRWEGIAKIIDVEEGYAFIQETGYLIPTWNISADMQAAIGGKYQWTPIVSAVK